MPSIRERLAGRFASASSSAVTTRVTTDTQDRFVIDAGGRLTWGSGSASGDVTLYRSAADTLTTDDVLVGSAGVVTTTVAGTPSASLPNGAIAVDTTNNKFFFRSGGTWQEVSGGGAGVVTQDASPTYAANSLWYESDTGKLFVGYDGYWVEVGSAGPVGPSGQWDSAQSINAQTDSYTLVAADVGKLVTLDKSTAVNLTVGTSLGLSAGQRIDIAQLGAGQVTVVASSTTVSGTPGLKLRAQYSSASLVCLSSNTYLLVGDLSA